MSSVIPGLIMLLVIGLFISVSVLALPGDSRVRRQKYAQQLKSALENNDLETASLAVRALLDTQLYNESLLIQRAIILEHQGQSESAQELMQQVVEKSRSSSAAYWLALKKYPLDNLSRWTEQDHSQFRSLMAVALADAKASEHKERYLTMAKYWVANNLDSEAIKLIEGLAPFHPDVAQSAALLCLRVGKQADANRYAQIAAKFYEKKLEADSSDKVSRVELARAYLMLERESDSVDLIRSTLATADSTEVRALYAEAIAAWVKRLKQQSPDASGLAQRLQLIFEALKIQPNHPLLIDSIIELALDARAIDEPSLHLLLAENLKQLDPGIIHFISGTAALLDGDTAKAETHLRIAGEQQGAMAGILNNLAVSLGSKEGADLEQALRFSELALRQLPDHPYFLETRGQILAKLGRSEEAVRDLERALKSQELAKSILPTLVDLYRKLGMDEIAEGYAKRIIEVP
ncbi:MAG: hypothetical protein KF752_09420 [Pirellulaceae bacterium]|nr:hypothetical protein [Pirellulaceae bacterium]